jgi:signal transduction histidine kinase
MLETTRTELDLETPPEPALLIVGPVPPHLALACRRPGLTVRWAASAPTAAAPEVALVAADLPDGMGPAVIRTLAQAGTIVLTYATVVPDPVRQALRRAGAWAVISDHMPRQVVARLVEAGLEVAGLRGQLREVERGRAHSNRLQLAGQMTAEAAHEINNIVAFVSANLRYLDESARWRREREQAFVQAMSGGPGGATARGIFGEEDDEEQRCHDELRDGVAQIGRLAGELRELARGCGGERQVLSVEALATRALDYAALKIDREVRLGLSGGGEVMVEGVSGELVQVLVNLVFNSLQALEGTPEPAVEITVESGGGEVRVYIEDNGPGIPAGDRERIFEPFFTTRTEGSGLGLAISRDIVARHGGALTLEAREQGCCFLVTLPATVQAMSA